MAIVKPFRAFRPAKGRAKDVASEPYDVINSTEARQRVEGKPLSFLHVVKSEIDLAEGIDVHDDAVYAKARENLDRLIDDGILVQEDQAAYYLYSQTMKGRTQIGIVACASVDDYCNDIIKKHEHTRAEKERDRVRHVDVVNANTGPVFLSYRDDDTLNVLIGNWIADHQAVVDITTDDQVRHCVWIVDEADALAVIERQFEKTTALYVADGHHRSAAAAKVGKLRQEKGDADPRCGYFLTVLFAESQLHIMDYNRVVRDLAGMESDEFLKALTKDFIVKKLEQRCRLSKRHTIGLYMERQWYELRVRAGKVDEKDPVASLDVALLQDRVLTPLLNISDPRTDERIDFVGGIRGLDALESRVDSGEMKIAFAMYPTSMQELLAVADAGKIMPPKSTWFEPKLRSGLFVHRLSEES